MNDTRPVYCEKCNMMVSGIIQATWEPDADVQYDGFGEPNELQYRYDYHILSCPQCGQPFLVKDASCLCGDRVGLSGTDILFPAGDGASLVNVPEVIVRNYKEARTNVVTKSYISSTIMVRRTMECIVRNLGYEKGRLVDAIDKMRNDGVIDQKLAGWFHLLRLEGNDAAHEYAFESDEHHAKECLVFLDAIIHYLYTMTIKYEQFMSNRNEKS